MTRKTAPKSDDSAQSKRFIDLAESVEPKDDKEVFGRAVKKVALSPKTANKR